MDNLTESQKEALEIARKKSKIHQKGLIYHIKKLLIDFEIDESFIDDFYKYINETTPIVSHGKFTLKDLIDDPKLKNCFELNNRDSSYLNYRREKESKLFNNKYITDTDRPKYASLNISNNNNGNPLCTSYGKNILFFKNDIKKRSSFVYGNSEKYMMYLCTFEYPHALLFHLNGQIKKVYGNINLSEKNTLSAYIEVQIHGNIDISNDINKIIIDKNNENNIKYIDTFRTLYPHIKLELI